MRQTYVFIGQKPSIVWCCPFETLADAIANRQSAVEVRLNAKTVWLAPGATSIDKK